jgi:superfamily II DNA or RNA helicase
VHAVNTLSPLEALLSSLERDGRGFELLCRWFLENDPEFRAEYERVWLWADWPGRWGPDRGIDLVAQTVSGRVDAVQAKNYGPDHTVTKRDIDTFLSESNRAGIGARLLIASTDKVARSAREVMGEQEKPVSTCLLSRLLDSPVPWPASLAELAPAPLPAATPRDHQLLALDAIERWAKTDGSRAQVIMACGTGKSLVEIWAAERLDAKRVLVLAPTIPLIRQLAREWPRHATTQRRLLRICSDKAAADAEDMVRGDELSGARTTDPEEIAAALRASGPLLVLCTYDSSPALAEAMGAVPDFAFDVAIADEAHRCAGLEGSRHKTILDGDAIRAARRLFFTATPTVYGTRDKSRAVNKNVRLASMDNGVLFGPVIHHLSFAQAIDQGLLCPYQVAVIPIDDDEVHDLIKRRRTVTADGDHNLEAAALATQIACARAMHRFGCRRIVAFHPTIADSKRFSEHFPIAVDLLPDDDRPQLPIWSEHVDGAGMVHATRMKLLARFQGEEPVEHRLLSNVRLLTEGVDVPGIDAIAFIDTRRGQGSIIQAVGRAVRPAPSKTAGTIVLPVVLRKGESFDAALARSEHRLIVDILGALRSHDPDIVKSLDELRFNQGPEDRPAAGHGRFMIDAPLQVGEEFAAAVDLALTGALGVASKHSSRRRARDLEPRLVPEGQPLSEEELLAIAINQLAALGRWELLAEVPPDDEDAFPLQPCWSEIKRRWAAGTLDEYDRATIANSVSWLARDLDAHTQQQQEMASLTDADLPEQIAAHCRTGGRYTAQFPGFSDWRDEDLVDALGSIQPLITHAAMSPRLRLRYLLMALRRLAAAVSTAAKASGEQWWEQGSWGRAATDGFLYGLELAHTAAFPLEQPSEPWTAREKPAASLIGRREAETIAPLARRMRIYRFAGDAEAVQSRRLDELDLAPDERLDALGWEIFLLAGARGDTWPDALRLAIWDSYRVRMKVRNDLRARSIRELEK